jgi:hypothetical protein
MAWTYTAPRSLEALGNDPSKADADAWIAGVTTHDALAAVMTGPATTSAVLAVVAAVLRRDERKAARRAEKAAA